MEHPDSLEVETPRLELRPSDEAAFLASIETLDHRASDHLRWLHTALLALVDEAEYTTDGELEHVTGWLHGDPNVPLYGLDGHGLLQLVLSTLPADEQLEFATEVAGLCPGEVDGAALVAAGLVEVDVPAHLDDQTLLEYLVDNLVEAMPGGREAFGTTNEPDYFAGVSAYPEPEDQLDAAADADQTTDPEPTADVTSSAEPEPASQTEAEAEAEAEAPAREPRAPHSRWLRRRGAA